MDRILGNKKIRRLFYSFFILLLIVLVTAKSFLYGVPYIDEILNDLIASIVSTVCIGSFVFYVFPKEKEIHFEVIEPTRIQQELEKGRLGTDYWYFTGGTGIFTRAVTLPELAKQARISNKPIELKLQLIDPLNQDLCQKYADYRRGLNTASNNRSLWTTKYVRNHSFATIIKAVIISSQEPLLDIKIGLKNNFSLFRLDISSSNVVVTKEDPREVAFVFHKSSTSFISYLHEFKETFKQTRSVKSYTTGVNLADLNKETAIKILSDLEIYIDIDDKDLEFIIDLVKNSKNPYA